MSKGGGGRPSQASESNTTIPSYARPYVERMLGQGEAIASLEQNPYQIYEGQRQAGFTPMQQQAFQGAAGLQPSAQLGRGTDIASQAGARALGLNYQAYRPAMGGYSPASYQAYAGNASPYQAFSPGAGYNPYQTGQFTASTARQYMSPYMQNVVDVEKNEAMRQSAQQMLANQAQATTQGAFGGGRSAIVEAERQRNLGQQMGDIQTRGLQAAYDQAANRFQQEQQMREQSRQYGAGLGAQMQQLAEQSRQYGADLGAREQELAERSRQFGAGFGAQERQYGAELAARERQLAEQSRQYGAGLGLQGLQTSLQSAGQLGTLGQQQFLQGMDINRLQAQYGGLQQQRQQNILNQAYQDFLTQQQAPFQRIGFMSDLLRGLPLSGSGMQSVYQAPPSAAQTMGALGLGAYGISQLAEGGEVGANSDGYFGDGGATGSSPYPSSFGLGGIALNKLVGGQG